MKLLNRLLPLLRWDNLFRLGMLLSAALLVLPAQVEEALAQSQYHLEQGSAVEALPEADGGSSADTTDPSYAAETGEEALNDTESEADSGQDGSAPKANLQVAEGVSSKYVDTLNGDSTYSVQIPLPVGRGELSPTISLNYSSGQKSAGLLGKGWSLAGLPQISRSGKGGGLAYYGEADDRFTISSPAAAGELTCLRDNQDRCTYQYQTRHNSFSVISRSDATNSWSVTTQDGLTYEFGGSSQSTFSYLDTKTFSTTHTWTVREVRDLYGNKIFYNWQNLNGIPAIDTIEYFNRRVKFVYSNLGHKPRLFLDKGSRVLLKDYLSKIFVTRGSYTLGGVVLQYNDPNKIPGNGDTNSYLTAITNLAAAPGVDTEVLSTEPPLTFSYSKLTVAPQVWRAADTSWGNTPFNLVPAPFVSAGFGADLGVRIEDIDGDGLKDLVYASRTLQPFSFLNRKIYKNYGVNGKNGKKGFAEVIGAGNSIDFAFVALDLNSGAERSRRLGTTLADLDGDGRGDIYSSWDWPNSSIPAEHFISFASKTSFGFSAKQNFSNLPLSHSHAGDHDIDLGLRFLDNDINGKSDLLRLCNEKSYAAPDPLQRCGGLTGSGVYINYYGGTQFSRIADLIYDDGELPPVYEPYQLLQGLAFQGENFRLSFSDYYPGHYEGGNYYNSMSKGTSTQTVDLNGDGLTDILAPADDFINYRPTNGAGSEVFWSIGRLMYLSQTPPVIIPYLAGDLHTISDGNGNQRRLPRVVGARPIFGPDRQSTGFQLVDLNYDGLPDYLSNEGVYWNLGLTVDEYNGDYYSWSQVADTRFALPSDARLINPSSPDVATGTEVVDIDGNGVLDLITSSGDAEDGTITAKLYFGSDTVPGLLQEVKLPAGGSLQFEYKPSTDFVVHKFDTNKGLPFAKQLLYKLTTVDGRGTVTSATETTFKYYNGKFVYEESGDQINYNIIRESRGFERVSVTSHSNISGLSLTADSWFTVDDTSLIGRPLYEAISGGGCIESASVPSLSNCPNLYSMTSRQYIGGGVNIAPPFFRPLGQEIVWRYENGVQPALMMAVDFTYDTGLGRLMSERTWGDDNPTGRQSVKEYLNNPALNLVLLCRESTYDQFSGGISRIASVAEFQYSGSVLGNCSGLPSNSSVVGTTMQGYVDGQLDPSARSEHWNIFDPSNGNLICSSGAPADPTCVDSRARHIAYDTLDQVLPVSKGVGELIEKTEYDNYLRAWKTVLPNGEISTISFDSLSRSIGVTRNGELVVRTKYHDDLKGNPGSQFVELEELAQKLNAAGGVVNNWKVTRKYYDGLDRGYYSEYSFTGDTSKIFCHGQIFGQQGKPVVTTLPYPKAGAISQYCDPAKYKFGVLPDTAVLPQTETTYDRVGRAVLDIHPDGIAATQHEYGMVDRVYDGRSLTVQAQWVYKPDGSKIRNFVDSQSRLREVEEYPELNGGTVYSTKFDYDHSGNLTAFTDNVGNISRYYHDGLGRRTRSADMDMANCGSTPEQRLACAPTTQYSARGDLVQVTDAEGVSVRSHYDGYGNLICSDLAPFAADGGGCDCVAPPANPSQSPTWFADKNDFCFTYHYAQVVDGSPDYSNGRLVKIASSSGVATYTYDALGRTLSAERWICLDRQTSSSGNDWECRKASFNNTMDVSGLVLKRRFDNNDAITLKYNYDYRARPVSVYLGATALLNGITYNDTNGQGEVLDGDVFGIAKLSNTYYDRTSIEPGAVGASQRLKSKSGTLYSNLVSQFLFEDYDLNGRLTKMTDSKANYSLGEKWEYSYDGLGRLTDVSLDSPLNESDEEIQYLYDSIGNRTALVHSRSNNTAHSPLVGPVEVMADLDLNQTVDLGDLQPFATSFSMFLPAVEVPWADLSMTDSNITLPDLMLFAPQFHVVEYTGGEPPPLCKERNIMAAQCDDYYLKGGVPGVTCPSLCMNGSQVPPPVSEVSWGYGADYFGGYAGPHAVSHDSRVSFYHYNKNGAITAVGGEKFIYDPRGRLSRGFHGNLLVGKYVYDEGGSRVAEINYSKCVPSYGGDCSASGAASEGIRRYFFGDYRELADSSGSRRIISVNLGGQKVLEVPTVSDLERTYIFFNDHLDSTHWVVDGHGVPLSTPGRSYYPFGIAKGGGFSAGDRFGFGGKEIEPRSMVYDFAARQYDPVMGRFLSADSIIPYPGDPQSWNRYSYTRNDPINRTDPTGHADADELGTFDSSGWGAGENHIPHPVPTLEEVNSRVERALNDLRRDDALDDGPGTTPPQMAYKMETRPPSDVLSRGLSPIAVYGPNSKIVRVSTDFNLESVYGTALADLGATKSTDEPVTIWAIGNLRKNNVISVDQTQGNPSSRLRNLEVTGLKPINLFGYFEIDKKEEMKFRLVRPRALALASAGFGSFWLTHYRELEKVLRKFGKVGLILGVAGVAQDAWAGDWSAVGEFGWELIQTPASEFLIGTPAGLSDDEEKRLVEEGMSQGSPDLSHPGGSGRAY